MAHSSRFFSQKDIDTFDKFNKELLGNLSEGKDLEQAMEWIDKAVEMTKDEPRFWFLRQQSLIHAANGDKKGAIAAAKKSLEGAKEAKNADYIKMNEDSLKEWGAM